MIHIHLIGADKYSRLFAAQMSCEPHRAVKAQRSDRSAYFLKLLSIFKPERLIVGKLHAHSSYFCD